MVSILTNISLLHNYYFDYKIYPCDEGFSYMPFKFWQICLILGKQEKQEIDDISGHLSWFLDLDSANMKSCLKLTKHQIINTFYNYLSSQTKKTTRYSPFWKRSRMTMKNKKMQKQRPRPKIEMEFPYSNVISR